MMPLYRVPSVMLSRLSFLGDVRCVDVRRDRSSRVVGRNPMTVTSAGDVSHPFFILKIPAHRLAESGFKGFFRLPTQFPFDLASIDRIAAIMARPVLHVRNEIAARASRPGRH